MVRTMFFVCSKRGDVYTTYASNSEQLENIFINVFINEFIKITPSLNSPFIALLPNIRS